MKRRNYLWKENLKKEILLNIEVTQKYRFEKFID
jgi:hypothetical protein